MGKASRKKLERRRSYYRADGVKVVPIDSPELREALKEQFAAFERKFGRPIGPEDPVFFDPDCDTPRPMDLAVVERELVLGLQKIGVHPAVLYAHQKTGLLLTEDNRDVMALEDLAKWEAAIDEYYELQEQAKV